MTNLNPMTIPAFLPTIERALDERRHEAARHDMLASARNSGGRSTRPARRALQLVAARLHVAG